MSLKANIEVAININHMQLNEFNKIGWIRYRICLYYTIKHHKKHIYYLPFTVDEEPLQKQSIKFIGNALIDQQSRYIYSPKYAVQYVNSNIHHNCTCYFKIYIDSELMKDINSYVEVDLLFHEDEYQIFEIVNSFKGRVNNFTQLFTYLPISFDAFESLSLCGSYNATVLEYKFQQNQEENQYLDHKYSSIQQFFQIITKGYRYNQIKNFYQEHRKLLENSLESIQNHFQQHTQILHQQLTQTLKNQPTQVTQHKQEVFKFVKPSKNIKFKQELDDMNWKGYQLTSEKKESFMQLILEDFVNLKAIIYGKWTQFNEFIRKNSKQITSHLKYKYYYQTRNILNDNIFSSRIKNHDWTFAKCENRGKGKIEQISQVNKKYQIENIHQNSSAKLQIQNLYFQRKQITQVKIFEEIYETSAHQQNQQKQDENLDHLIILVHGFQASKFDFLEWKYCLESYHKVKVYVSQINSGKTEDSLQILGKRLAIEVHKYVQKISRNYKVSFIGHSMGGLIIRSALGYLSHQIKSKLHAYISISTPHLGYLYSSSNLVKAGLWLLNTWQKCDSILELSMKDQPNLRDCFLYKLAAKQQLDYFTKVTLISSSQDEYVSFESARIQKNAQLLTESDLKEKQSLVICEMVENLLCEIKATEISRINVIFNIKENNFDSLTGRTAHVQFLCDQAFIRIFAICLNQLFQ